MSDLVERYVHQVGRYLPKDERKEVENELRSLIQDQLDDRYKGAPTDEDIIELLAEFGEPQRMAASYGGEKYLVGPDLYPIMMWVLQRGWVLIPAIVVLVNVVVALVSAQESTLLALFLDTLFLVAQAVFIFTAVVVLLFAVLQQTGVDINEVRPEFNPRELPPVDDPTAVDRAEAAFGIAFGIFGTLILFYFRRVGGLTLIFNLSEPGTVIPVPLNWLTLAIFTTGGLVVVNLVALLRGRWSAGLLLVEAMLELAGAVAAYFVFLQPLFNWLYATVPALAGLPFADNAAEITAVVIAFLTLLDTGTKLVKVLWYGRGGRPFISVDTDK